MTDKPLSDGWWWARLGEVCDINPRLKNRESVPPDLSMTFLPMAAVNQDYGVIERTEVRPFGEVCKGFTPCMQNGKSAIANGLVNGMEFGSTEFHILRPSDKVLSESIFCFLRQRWMREYAQANFTGTVGQQHAPEEFMENLRMPLPPLPLQHRFAAQMEAFRALRARLDDLFQSLLHRAFAGELI